MRRRITSALLTLSVSVGMGVGLASGANAQKIVERYQGTVKELKQECGDAGGSFVGTKNGKAGVCIWDDGSSTSCVNKKGKNCATQARLVTPDGQFLDFVTFALADPGALQVVPGTGGGQSSDAGGLLDKKKATLTPEELARVCGDELGADLITSTDDRFSTCMDEAATLFCDREKSGKNCHIERVKKSSRKLYELVRVAMVDPSSVLIVVPTGGSESPNTPQSSGSSSTSTSSTSTSTSTSTTPTTEPGPSIL